MFQELFGGKSVQGKNQRFRHRQRSVFGRLLQTGRKPRTTRPMDVVGIGVLGEFSHFPGINLNIIILYEQF